MAERFIGRCYRRLVQVYVNRWSGAAAAAVPRRADRPL